MVLLSNVEADEEQPASAEDGIEELPGAANGYVLAIFQAYGDGILTVEVAGQMTDYPYTGPFQLLQDGVVATVLPEELVPGTQLLLYLQEGTVQAAMVQQSSGGGMAMGGMGGGGGFSGGSGGGTNQSVTPSYELYTYGDTPLLSITAQDTAKLSVLIDELDILSLNTGLEAQVTLDAMKGRSFTGTVSRISPTGTNAGGSTKFTVTVSLPREAGMLDGMNASVKITTSTARAAVTIPAAALVEQDGKTWVYTAYNEKQDVLGGLTEVTTGLSDGSTVEILSGLAAGDPYYYRCADTVTYQFLAS